MLTIWNMGRTEGVMVTDQAVPGRRHGCVPNSISYFVHYFWPGQIGLRSSLGALSLSAPHLTTSTSQLPPWYTVGLLPSLGGIHGMNLSLDNKAGWTGHLGKCRMGWYIFSPVDMSNLLIWLLMETSREKIGRFWGLEGENCLLCLKYQGRFLVPVCPCARKHEREGRAFFFFYFPHKIWPNNKWSARLGLETRTVNRNYTPQDQTNNLHILNI